MNEAQKNVLLIAAIKSHRMFKEGNFHSSPTDEWDKQLWRLTQENYFQEWEEDD
jgi:hypothetical protein